MPVPVPVPLVLLLLLFVLVLVLLLVPVLIVKVATLQVVVCGGVVIPRAFARMSVPVAVAVMAAPRVPRALMPICTSIAAHCVGELLC